ncbi:MAG: M14 family metallopeptidase [Bacteroidales bacterium]
MKLKMYLRSFIPAKFILFWIYAALLAANTITAQLPSPGEHFGFEPGEDRMLFHYEDLVSYLMRLTDVSPEMHMEQIGESELGKPVYAVFISSAENIGRLDQLKAINRELALNGDITPEDQKNLIREGRVFVFLALSMHATEVGPSQAAPAIAYELLTSAEPRVRQILDNTVCVLLPSHNPDGMNMIVEHYNKYKGTPFEGSSMPGVYHKYVGHNINRDFVTLTQKENKAVATFYNTEWYPQVTVEKHQMGSSGPRYFVSPPHDPIAENIDASVWNWMRVFGSRALIDMTNAGLKGVSVNYLFDDYWPGATTTCIWKGVIGMLSEAASANLATPVYVEPSELKTVGKGLGEYAKSINMPEPWTGGWWRLSDIVTYENINTLSYLFTAAIHKDEILKFRNEYTKREIEKGQTEAPFYYMLPLNQHDQSELISLVNLMIEHGVNIFQLTENTEAENRMYSKGDIVIPLAQPYRAFIREMMTTQKFPERHYTPDGEMIKPYDVTSWSLPLHKGVESHEINSRVLTLEKSYEAVIIPFRLVDQTPQTYHYMLFTTNSNESYKAAFMAVAEETEVMRTTEIFIYDNKTYPIGSFLMKGGQATESLVGKLDVGPVYIREDVLPEAKILEIPRIALIESWFHAMDAGWIRFLFDNYHLPYTVVRPDELKGAKLAKSFDVIILTDEPKSVLLEGMYGSEGNYFISRYPAEFAKGMGKKGLENLLRFVDEGGTLLSWGRSVDLFTGLLSIGDENDKEQFQLPFRNIGSDLAKKGLEVPGSALRTKLHDNHPLTYGMPEEVGVFHHGNPVFETSIPYFDMDRRVIASFTDDKILMSGYADHEKLLAKKAAMVWLKKGKGQFVLYSFSPHHRGQTPVTYKLLWNGVLLD